MKQCTKCKCSLPLSAFAKNSRAKDGLQYHCRTCKLEYQRNNPRRVEVTAKYRNANKAICNQRTMESVRKNREYYNSKARDRVAAHKEHVLALRRSWYAKNSAADIERVRRRAGRIKGANLSLAEQAEVNGLYRFCSIFSGYEVDHIVPLNGKLVSGLHVPRNLQVLPVFENRSKGNKFFDDESTVLKE